MAKDSDDSEDEIVYIAIKDEIAILYRNSNINLGALVGRLTCF